MFLILCSSLVAGTFDPLIEELRTACEVEGASVAILADQEVLLSKGYGTKDGSHPVTPSTLFPVGSISKGFTSFLIGQLMEEGLLHLDDPVSLHIPYFRLKDPYTTYLITLRDYLSHVSGYPKGDALWFNEVPSREEIVRRLRFVDPIYPLRKAFLYQNVGYVVAGHAAEKATGKTLEELFQERIFRPLGMNNTTCSIHDAKEHIATGYHKDKPIPFVDATPILPAGGINSSADDLILWLQTLLRGGEGFLQPDTFRELITPHARSNIVPPQLAKEVLMESYALGWMVISYRGHIVIMHGGSIDGFASFLAFLPKEQLGIAILCNQYLSPFPPLLFASLLDQLLGLPPIDWLDRYKALSAGKPIELPLPKGKASHPSADYTGSYSHPGYGTLLIQGKDSLTATYHGLRLPLESIRYDSFQIVQDAPVNLRGARLKFQENFRGEISSLLIQLQDSEILFMKEQETPSFTKEYLEQFIGKYTYMGFTFTVEASGESLIVKAFGQPPYDLVPSKENMFLIRGMEGYSVHFTPTTIQLIQPNQTSYIANKL